MSGLLILGAGGHAKVVAETALASGMASSFTFLDDSCIGLDACPPVLGWPVIGPLALSLQAETAAQFDAAVVAIGHAATRLHWIQQLQNAGYHLPVLVHPTAWVSPSASLDQRLSSLLTRLCRLRPPLELVRSSTQVAVDHDAQLADGVHICPGARLAGEVNVAACSWIGIGASVIQQVRGSDVTVGAAAVVRDVPKKSLSSVFRRALCLHADFFL